MKCMIKYEGHITVDLHVYIFKKKKNATKLNKDSHISGFFGKNSNI